MTDENSIFVIRAEPHSWFLIADELHSQAINLYADRGQSLTHFRNSESRSYEEYGNTRTWDMTDRSVFLLGGFALENAIKAFLVYENPNWISNGRLSSKLRSHSLTKLQAQSTIIPRKKLSLPTLAAFEAGLESWARYPCGLTANDSERERVITDQLWSGYMVTMQGYSKNLIRLLKRRWKGPHGHEVRYEISGDWMS